MRPLIGFIGAGSVAEFHIEAARAVGFDLHTIGARLNSKNAHALYEKYRFKNFESDISQILDLKLDALAIITNTGSLLPLYNKFRLLNIPILIEKPVASNLIDFEIISDLDDEKTLVGFNRRFYSSIEKIKNNLFQEPVVQFTWQISELANTLTSTKAEREKSIRENAVHNFDLITYLFGDLKNFNIEKQYDEFGLKSISTLLRFNNNSIGNLNIAFNLPLTYKAQINTKSKVFQLNPIEAYQEFSHIEINEPTPDLPIRVYKSTGPKWDIDPIDVQYKPGFFKQYLELMNMVLGLKKIKGASLRDAKNAIEFAESIINS
jgi:predicted dehydrogenase